MSIQIEQLSYEHPNREVLFQNISLNLQDGQKATIIGNNGVGKSTLLKILAKQIDHKSGTFRTSSLPYFVPQHFGQFDTMTIYEALDIGDKVEALHQILKGKADAKYFDTLNDDWEIEERTKKTLATWQIDYLDPHTPFASLSGGEKTKVFLAGIELHQPQIVLMDEPSNHLDYRSREQLTNFIKNYQATMLIVSHDKTILNLVEYTYELSRAGIKYYAGNYDAYEVQKEIETNAIFAQLENKEKELRTAKKLKQEMAERRQKLDARGRQHEIKKGMGKMELNIMQDKAEKSTAKLHDTHGGKIENILENISEIESNINSSRQMKINFNSSKLHKGKILAKAKELNFFYSSDNLWTSSLDFLIQSGERILLKGLNGSGKSTLIKLLLKELTATSGELYVADFEHVYLDQEYSMIDNRLTIYEQAKAYAPQMMEHDVKMNLNRFLFDYTTWEKRCEMLSGGEKMKLSLCCLLLSSSQPDIIILDEPTNNIDLKNINILISCIRDYEGTIILVSHDQYFIEQVDVNYEIELR